MTDIRNPIEIAPSRVSRRVKRLNERREANNPLWATAGEKVLTQVAGPRRTADEVEEELRAYVLDVENRLDACRAEMEERACRFRETLRPYFTPPAFASLDRKRCSYPLDPVYAADYWRGLCRELLGADFTLVLLTALLILAQPLALISAFEIAHACYCSLYGEVR